MAGRVDQTCRNCGRTTVFTESDDNSFNCRYCGAQSYDFANNEVDELEPHHSARFNRRSLGSQRKIFSYDEYYSEIRSRYLNGFQVMIQLQCQTLVEKFNVSPLIVGLFGPVWLRFLASTGIMSDEWADQAVHESEAQTPGKAEEFQSSAKYCAEPVNIHGQRLVMIWYKSLRSRIPIHYSLAISFLVCHVAREAIMPSDLLKWALEGKLPYFAAFGEIEKHIGLKSEACPISINRMFRPIRLVSSQKLESTTIYIAKKIGLELPPVNFYAIASRFCMQLSLPTKEILSVACRICEWSRPPELYLSVNELSVHVMSILIVAIRIIFDINGYGMWELSLSDPSRGKKRETEAHCHFNATVNADKVSSSNNSEPHGSDSDVLDSNLNVAELLQILEAKYNDHDDVNVYSYDLPSYLQYCKDVVFSGIQPSYKEENLMKEFWDFYQNSKDMGTVEHQVQDSPRRSDAKRSRNATNSSPENTCNVSHNSGTSDHHSNCRMDQEYSSHEDQDPACSSRSSMESRKERAVQELKLDMEENKFRYVAPRTKVKRRDYLHYARKRKEVYIYAVHADYYILLRSCAKVAQVETRVMHGAVLSFERRLKWLEKRIDGSLHYKQNSSDVCDLCREEPDKNDGNIFAKESNV